MNVRAWLLLTLVAFAGCAGWRERLVALPGSVARERQERQSEVVRDFEQHRDNAQLQAALDRWAAGDIAGCDSRLRALLQRRPVDSEARIRLAELLWTRGAAPEAE